MKQLSSKELQIYKHHVFEQVAEAFDKIGSLDIEYLDKVTNLEYEISDVTNLIYPRIKFYDTFEELQTLSKIELHKKPNDLLREYKLQALEVPALYTYNRLGKRKITPYNEITNLQPYIEELPMIHFSNDDIIILTDGAEKEYEFVDKTKNPKTYLLPINYENKNGTKLYENYRQLKTKLKNIVDNIEPIDGQKLYDLIIKYYKN